MSYYIPQFHVEAITYECNLAQIGSKSSIFQPVWSMNLKNNRAPILYYLFYTTSFVHHFKSIGELKLKLQPGNAQFGSKSAIFVPCDLEILLKFDPNHRFFSPCDLWTWKTIGHLFYTTYSILQALCIISNPLVNWNWSYSPETLNSGQNQQFLSRVTLKFDGWPWKIIGHLFYTTSSFIHHFKAMGEFKLELQSRNAQFGPKSAIFCPVWP